MPELNTVEHYKIAQSKFKCKIGDRVRVFRSCKSRENGWYNSWVHDMNYCVGRVGTIGDIDAIEGIFLEEFRFWFPYFCLDILE